MSARRVVAVLLVMLVGATMISVLSSAPAASAAPAGAAPPDSAMTLSGKPSGEFAGLQVTVSQTKSLINQVVTVTWKGGVPTQPVGQFGTDYLQMMQCWGDDPNGPDRIQCQYGASVSQAAPSAGLNVKSRQVTNQPNLVDPKETLKAANSVDNAFVPFWPVGKNMPDPAKPATSNANDFFDALGTNEIAVARTQGDGTGQAFFEIQTVRQAAGLGCGELGTGGATTGRKCWLVVVPRGKKEVNGSTRSGTDIDRIDSSPLSQTNWDNRIVFPLEFLPVGQNCPIGAPERRVIGHELAADAVGRWQPALCAGGGALFSYTQLGDDVARNQVLDGSSPGLALVTNPLPPDQAPPESPLVYAPVGLSGLAIAFNVEAQPATDACGDKVQSPTDACKDVKLDGRRFLSMKLTPRLVAKLLTQSYRGAVAGQPDYLKNNPVGLTVDPEFLAINTEYKYTGYQFSSTPPDALVQLGGSDLTSLLWSWVKADPDASAFLAGTPDPSGMTVNPKNKGLPLPTSTFPRNDEGCNDVLLEGNVPGKICTLDAHPFTNDMHDAGLSASRGDSQARTLVAVQGTPTVKKVDRQTPGKRALLAVVDAATAARYDLPTASLLNAAKQYVAPTAASLLAGEAAMKPSAMAGVLASDPGAADPAAYPLTALSYAATQPSKLDAAAGKDYSAFLRYAGGKGQEPGVEPGQLPFGMAPLPDALKTQTIAAAATIEAQAGKTADGAQAQQPGAAAGPADGGGSNGGGTSGGGASGGGASGGGGGASDGAGPGTSGSGNPGAGTPSAPGSVQSPAAGTPGAAAAGEVATQSVAEVRRTPSLPAPAVGALLVTLFICGGLATASSLVTHRMGTKRDHVPGAARNRAVGAVRRRTRRGVMPTGP